MAWTDQCKIAFKTNAEHLLWQSKKETKKGLWKILSELSNQSGIPQKTLYHWWRELEKEKEITLKNQSKDENDVTVENNTETDDKINAKNAESIEIPIPICKRCNINKVYVDKRKKKPYSENSKYYGLCATCRDRQLNINKIDDGSDDKNGVLAICTKCNHGFYISKERIDIMLDNRKTYKGRVI